MCLDVLGMHGQVEEVWSGSSACWFDRSLVPGDVNPHGNGLGACEADGRAVVVEVGATAVLEGLRGRIVIPRLRPKSARLTNQARVRLRIR